jgi:hypothetical protein
MGTSMYSGVGNEIGRTGEHGLGVRAAIWGGGEIITYLHSWAFPFQKANRYSHTKQYERPINSSVAVRVSRRAHNRSGGDILTL